MENYRKNVRIVAIAVFALTLGMIAYAWIKKIAGVEFAQLSLGSQFYDYFIAENRWISLAKGLIFTILAMLGQTIFGVILGSLEFLWVYSGSKFAMKFMSIMCHIFMVLPTSTWFLFCFYLIFAQCTDISFFVVVFAVGIALSSDFYGVISGSVGTVRTGEIEAAASMGYDKYGILINVLIPQAFGGIIGGLTTVAKAYTKATALAGMAMCIDFQAASDAIRSETGIAFLPIVVPALVYSILGTVFGILIGKLHLKNPYTNKTPEEIIARVMRGKI